MEILLLFILMPIGLCIMVSPLLLLYFVIKQAVKKGTLEAIGDNSEEYVFHNGYRVKRKHVDKDNF